MSRWVLLPSPVALAVVVAPESGFFFEDLPELDLPELDLPELDLPELDFPATGLPVADFFTAVFSAEALPEAV